MREAAAQGRREEAARSVPLPDEAATDRLGRALAGIARAGDVIALWGDLGAGKTRLARAFIGTLTGEDEVPSPTFTLVQTYEAAIGTLWHFDLYRLTAAEEAFELGLDEALSGGVVLIEWPDRLGRLLPQQRLDVRLQFAGTGDARLAALDAHGAAWSAGWSRCDPMQIEAHPVLAATPPETIRGAREPIIDRFLAGAGWGAAARRPLAGDASGRRYERLDLAGRRAVLMDAAVLPDSARRFAAIAALLRRHRFSAPQIYADSADAGLLLTEDLGDDGFMRLLAHGADERRLYALAVDVLVALRRRVPDEALKDLPAHDEPAILSGLARFIDWHWPARFGAPAPEPAREDFIAAWRAVLPLRRSAPEGLALFDYHADNLMLLGGREGVAACGLIDFQDAVRAPVTLDLACLLEDVRRDVDPALAAAMGERYLAAFPELDRAGFSQSWAVVAAERNARILGTFTRLWQRDGKPGYLAHMPRAWRHLERDLAHPALAPVRAWFDRHFSPELRRSPLGPTRTE